MSAETASDDVTLASSGTVPEHTQIVVQVHRTAALPVAGNETVATAVHVTACPGRKPPFWAVKCPARPYKSAIQNGFP